MNTNTRPLVLTVTQAGLLLGVSRSTAYALVRTGELQSVQLRRRVVVPLAVVAAKLQLTPADVLALTQQSPPAGIQTEYRYGATHRVSEDLALPRSSIAE